MSDPSPGAAVVRRDLPDQTEIREIDRLQQQPIIDRIDARTRQLIKSQIAPGCSDGEVGHFLELCAHYDLDPFAREAWCAKSKTGGKLLILVGRDGLRKIAQRNGLHVDGDVVREHDDFTICRTPDGNRTVAHSYKNPVERGAIIGAWAEVREGGPLGKPLGYFYAPLDEYKPDNGSQYSPWAKQIGVMILAAAERQAIRQATPLSGLMASGEEHLVNENERPSVTAGAGDGEARGIELAPAVESVIERAADVGHAGLSDRATIEMAIDGQPDEYVQQWVESANRELSDYADRQAVPDAEVVE